MHSISRTNQQRRDYGGAFHKKNFMLDSNQNFYLITNRQRALQQMLTCKTLQNFEIKEAVFLLYLMKKELF